MDLQPKPIALLPQDREIMEITGLSEAQYRSFVLECYRQGKLKPGEPTNFLVIPFLIQLTIGIALTYLATLLAPKPEQPEEPKAQKNRGGQNYVSGQRFAPTAGFDTVQNVVELGSIVPLIYANRRQVNGRWYGGVRVNTNMLWNQLYSIGGGQLLRALFAVGEGTLPQPDPDQFAIGNNLLRNYDLEVNDVSRLSVYYVDGSEENNRINSSDHIAGRVASEDLGNAENDGAADVFQVRTATGWAPDFSYVITPSNQSTFGVGPFIGNNFPYRVNPQIKPIEFYNEEPTDTDDQAVAERRKNGHRFSGRAGVHALNGAQITDSIRNLSVGDRFTYTIFADSDDAGYFQSQANGADGFTYTKDVANAVASRQNSYDDAIQIGDRYLAGTCIAVCVSRTAEAFNSEVSNFPVSGGNNVTAIFEVVKAGSLHFWTETGLHPPLRDEGNEGNQPTRAGANTATLTSHLMKVTEGYVTTERDSRYIEIGLRSTVNMNLNGICAWRQIDRDYGQIDDDRKDRNIYYTNPTYTAPEYRYSCFRVSYRRAGEANFTEVPDIFAVRSLSSSAVYNYLRFEFQSESTYELKMTPVSAYETRNSSSQINVLDYKNNNRASVTRGGVRIFFSGEANLARSYDNFAVPMFRSSENLNGREENFYHVDGFARLAESFIYNEVSSSASGPEHDIVYVDTQTPNDESPNYSFLAMVGLNIRSSREINSLQQFSVYCNQGIGSTNKFPEVLYDLMTNSRYGAGEILNAEQIDKDSFDDAATFCEARRYFFDGVIDDKVNIRSWGAQVARNFLLDLIVRNGKFALQPVCNFDNNPVTITGLFTAGNILEDTFEMSYADEQNRIPPRVSVRWRQEKASTDGLFPVVRQLTVREATTPEDAPLESIDLSEYCTSEEHAIDVAKYICRTRRLITHSVKFSTTPTQAALDIGAVFKLGMETVTYQQPQNGAISDSGVVTAWPPLGDGTYDVLLWDGTGQSIQEVSMTISSGRTTYKNAVFCIRNVTANTQTYKTQSLSYNEEGNIEVEATIYPTDADGRSLIVDGWDVAANWNIEGQLY